MALSSPFLQLLRPVRIVISETPWSTHYRLKTYPVDPRDQFQFVSDLISRANPLLMAAGVRFATALGHLRTSHDRAYKAVLR